MRRKTFSIVAIVIFSFLNISAFADSLTPPGTLVQYKLDDVIQILNESSVPESNSPLQSGAEPLGSGETIPEIVELARGLRNDPDLIYKYVRDNIEYTLTAGLIKGPYMTLMDGCGNDWDQASLLIALLRQSGYTANYVRGRIQMIRQDYCDWVAVSKTVPDEPNEYTELDHIWVKVDVNGTDYVFDPSLKIHSYSQGINLGPAMGYNQNNFLTSILTGATVNPDYVQNLNKSNLTAELTSYSSNLINYIKTNSLGAALGDIIGKRSIIPVHEVTHQTSLPYQIAVYEEFSEVSGDRKGYLRIEYEGIDETLYSADIYGKRLTLFYNNQNQPVLALDGEALAIGNTTTPGALNDITFTARTFYLRLQIPIQASRTKPIKAGGSYSIVNSWGSTGPKIIEKHRKILKQNISTGGTAESEPVLGESLTILGMTHLAQEAKGMLFTDHLVGTTTSVSNYVIGICGQYDSPYIDLCLSSYALISSHEDELKTMAYAITTSSLGSALEWGIFDQSQPYSAVSTIKLLDIANVNGHKIYEATSENFYGHDGIATQDTSAMHTEGKIYGALAFDGYNDYVEVNDDEELYIADAISISAWIKTSDRTGTIVCKQGASGYYPVYTLEILREKLRFYTYAGGWKGLMGLEGASVADEQWHHVVASFDSSTGWWKIYLDNDSYAIEQEYANLPVTDSNLSIGARKGDIFFDGVIDNVMIFDKVLTTNEVSVLYNAGSGTEEFDHQNLVGHWRMNDNADNTRVLESSKTLEGRLVNYDSSELSNVEEYIDEGYRVFLPEDGNIGEGSWSGIGFVILDSNTTGYMISGGFNGGHSSGEEPFSVTDLYASIIVDPTDLSLDTHAKSYDPIDLVTGNYLYESSDLKIGSGGYPFSLDFERYYNSGSQLDEGPLGFGWGHNFNITAKVSSDGFQGMGADSPIDAVASIVQNYVSMDLLTTSDSLTNSMITFLAQKWRMDEMIDNVVTIKQPGNTMQFVKLPDGSYNPPPGDASTLGIEGDGSYLLRAKHGEYLDFDPNGKISSWYDPNNTVTFNYTNDKLSQVSNQFGRTINFTYDGNSIDYVTDSASRTVDYGYDGAGNLTTVTDANGFVTTFVYDPNNDGQITQIYYPSEPNNPYVTNVYDSLGCAKEQTDANNHTYQYYYSGYLTEEVDPNGFSKRYKFNNLGRMIAEENQLGEETLHEYDGQQRQKLVTYPRGNSTRYSYDSSHNVNQITQIPIPESNEPNVVESFVYEPNFNHVTVYTEPNGNVTNYSYYANGKLKDMNQPEVGGIIPQTCFTYNAHGQMETKIDAEGTITKYEYDESNGNLLRIIVDYGTGLNLNITIEMTYNAAGDVNSTTDPRGNTTTFEYDSMRRLKKETTPAPFNYETRYEYDADGNLELVKKQTGDANQPWQTTSYTYTFTGKKETATDPNGNVTQYEYDLLDRLWKTTDAENNITEQLYDAAGRLWKVIDANDNNNIIYTYTSNGNVEILTDANGNTTTYEYDDYDRLEKTIYPDSTYDQLSYDTAGNIIQRRTRVGEIISYNYDALNRMISKTIPENPQIIYTYDLVNRVVDVNYGYDITHNDYDNIGRLASVTYPDEKVIFYTYDTAGNRTYLVYPDGEYLYYEYDELNRMTDIWDPSITSIAHYEYDALSRRVSSQLGNGTMVTYNYDIANRLLGLNNQTNSGSHSFAYTYDDVGNRLTMTVNGSDSHGYTYDKIYQLTDVNYPDGFFAGDTTFNYDSAANRQSVINGGTTNYATNNLNQYSSVGGVGYDYDDNGNLTDDSINSYTYDAENQLISATTPSSSVVYSYDPMGRRISKAVNGKVTRYLYDGDQVICEYDGYDRLRRKFVYGTGIDEAVRMTNVWPSADIVSEEPLAMSNPTDGIYFMAKLVEAWLEPDNIFTASTEEELAQDTPKEQTPEESTESSELYVTNNVPVNTGMLVLALSEMGGEDEYDEPQATTEIVTNNDGDKIAEIISDSQGRTIEFTMYPDDGSRVSIATTYDDEGNVASNLCTTYDDEGSIVSIEDRPVLPPAPQLSSLQLTETTSESEDVVRVGMMMGVGEAGSGAVDFVDFAALAQSWMLDGNDTGFNPNADLNCDDEIDLQDAAILSEYWLSDGDRSENYYYHFDGLGSVIALSDENGDTVETYNYDVYGQVDSNSTVGNPYLFTGRRLDLETALYYYRARYYSPSIGRFLQTDPEGYSDSMNLYQYCLNNPINFLDPSGLRIYLMTGNDARIIGTNIKNPLQNATHQSIVVDTGSGKRAFSFGASGFGLTVSSEWLGEKSLTATLLKGQIYETGYADGKVNTALNTTAKQDREFLQYLESRVGEEAGYSVGRHNCRKFSQLMFSQAEERYGKK